MYVYVYRQNKVSGTNINIYTDTMFVGLGWQSSDCESARQYLSQCFVHTQR